ncbi:hypothetical protein Q7A_03695 [Methylophaga nitratireducenticrescens]|nr:hypothetical protein Q7A_3114 [Methylophaga nitratireducenticrescens]ASF49142.1 hypothetical protein Q7A_03695 [Methylophaga nitratireducenticrescens]AUZ85103.1 hypothetical protein CDW43_11190 [Methylophaga nitratireducenticrescens]AUZ85588.1 hypothetical protein CDW43_13890 [Methylophaga nitratireducenticrescens]
MGSFFCIEVWNCSVLNRENKNTGSVFGRRQAPEGLSPWMGSVKVGQCTNYFFRVAFFII